MRRIEAAGGRPERELRRGSQRDPSPTAGRQLSLSAVRARVCRAGETLDDHEFDLAAGMLADLERDLADGGPPDAELESKPPRGQIGSDDPWPDWFF